MNLLFLNDNVRKLSEDAYLHLAVGELVEAIGITLDEQALLRKIFPFIPMDEETVIYRQEILKDLLNDGNLCEDLEVVLKNLEVLKEFKQHSHFSTNKKVSLLDLTNYMQEMDVYIQVVTGLNEIFEKYSVNSKGLTEIKELLKEVIDSDRINEMKEIVNNLRTDVSALKSVTVGINLDGELYPEEVIVLDYSTTPIRSPFEKTSWALSMGAKRAVKYREPSPFMKYICSDMERELSKTVARYKSELKKYINFKGYFLLDICNDLKVYLMLAKYGRKIQDKGYSICFPAINQENEVKIKGIYNIRLAIKEEKEIVKNDFIFDKKDKVFILTGPNRGGKTMLTQALGLTALFAAQGWFVCADSYEGFVFENILTHFPADENMTLDLGRLGEEAVRIQTIVKQATNKTLVLLNETYSSTSSQDGLYLAQDLVHILKCKGIPTVFNTHIHELAKSIPDMNKWEGESEVVSLTMEIVNNVNTYRVLRKKPDACSFARNIALKYGVTYEQLLESMEQK